MENLENAQTISDTGGESLSKITEFLDFGATFDLDRIFFIFFSYWRCVQCTHLSKTEFLAVVSKMAILSQTVIFDICWILPIFGTVTSSFSMENRLLANFPYWNPDFEMTPGGRLAEGLSIVSL